MRFFPEPPTRTRNLAAVPGWDLAGTGYLLVTLLLAFPLVRDIGGVRRCSIRRRTYCPTRNICSA